MQAFLVWQRTPTAADVYTTQRRGTIAIDADGSRNGEGSGVWRRTPHFKASADL
jgi:hypothetical protein